MRRKLPILLLLLFTSSYLFCQQIPEHISNSGIYSFLDEMANEKLIEVNSAIKPYTKSFISSKLVELSSEKSKLNKRQQKELSFYLKEYNLELYAIDSLYSYKLLSTRSFQASMMPFGFYYHDSLFRIMLRPQWGVTYFSSTDSMFSHQWGGAELHGYVGNHLGFYASLTDHTQSTPLSSAGIITHEQGATLKGESLNNYSEIRGGITYSWDWGNIGLIKDNIQWGEHSNGSNIFSGRTQSVAMLKFQMKPSKWFEFNYFHARLASNVLDSSLSYTYQGNNTRLVMRPKYIASNMFTLTPWKRTNISFGNSIVYSDEKFQIQYLIPFMFFKSVDDTYNATENQAGNNSQLFATISSRNIKHLHLYASVFIDEMSIKRMFKPTEQSNYASIKVGAQCSNFPIKNLSFVGEYTRNNPMVYQHFIPATTFASGNINMGSYLGDNADEIFLSISYRPLSRLLITLSATTYRLGTRYIYGTVEPWGIPFMDNVVLKTQQLSIKASYQPLTNIYLVAEVTQYSNSGDDRYNPAYLRSNKTGNNYLVKGSFAIGF